MSIHEIVLPETKPETEWLLGRAVQKVSPRREHGRLQGDLYAALRAWETGHGHVSLEWRFRIAPPGEIRRPLVPDVAFVSSDRLRGLDEGDLAAPPFAPDVAVEIVSPGDSARTVQHKIAVYRAGGAKAVMVVDPVNESITVHDADGVRVLRRDDTLTHPALPGFSLQLSALFRAIDPP